MRHRGVNYSYHKLIKYWRRHKGHPADRRNKGQEGVGLRLGRRLLISTVVTPTVIVSTLIVLAFVGVGPFVPYKDCIRENLFPTDQEVEEGIFEKINEHRAYDGLGLYIRDPFLDELAREHARWLHDREYYDRVISPLMKDMPSYPTVTGLISNEAHAGFEERADKIRSTLGAHQVKEGVAFGYKADEVFSAWMRSILHHGLITDGEFRRAGIGVVSDGFGSTRYSCLIVCD
ncbi:hypothetical protein ES703_68055 [subsurface metagenome]